MTDDTQSNGGCVREGEAYLPDPDALLSRFGGLYLYRLEGGAMFVGIPGRGEVWIDDLLQEEKAATPARDRSGTVVSIKPKGTQQ